MCQLVLLKKLDDDNDDKNDVGYLKDDRRLQHSPANPVDSKSFDFVSIVSV